MPGTKLLNQWQVAIGIPGTAVGVTIVYMGRDEGKIRPYCTFKGKVCSEEKKKTKSQLGHFDELILVTMW